MKLNTDDLKKSFTSTLPEIARIAFEKFEEDHTLYFNLSSIPSNNIYYDKRTVLFELFNLYERYKHLVDFRKSSFSKILINLIYTELQLDKDILYPVANTKTIQKYFQTYAKVKKFSECFIFEKYYITCQMLKSLPENYASAGGGDRMPQVDILYQFVNTICKSNEHGTSEAERKILLKTYELYLSIKDFAKGFTGGSILKSKLRFVLAQHLDINEYDIDFDTQIDQAIKQITRNSDSVFSAIFDEPRQSCCSLDYDITHTHETISIFVKS